MEAKGVEEGEQEQETDDTKNDDDDDSVHLLPWGQRGGGSGGGQEAGGDCGQRWLDGGQVGDVLHDGRMCGPSGLHRACCSCNQEEKKNIFWFGSFSNYDSTTL